MTTDDLARQGIEALRAGDKAQARRLLTQVIEANPNHQIALLWLATAVDSMAERRQYLERAVAVNPNNDAGQRAAMGLAQMTSEGEAAEATQVIPPRHAPPPAAEPVPPQESQEPQSFFGVPSSTPSDSRPSSSPEPSSSPFHIPSSDQPSPFQSSVPPPDGSSSAGSQPAFTPPPISTPPPQAKSSSNTRLIIGIVSAVILIPCICLGGVFGGLYLIGSNVDDSAGVGLPSTSQGSLDMGDEVEGALYSMMEADEWTFEGEAGQRVTIRCEAARGEDTDPRIHLLGPDGDTITSDDDSGSGYDAIIDSVRLPDDGTYTIQVDVFTEGEYVLSLEEE